MPFSRVLTPIAAALVCFACGSSPDRDDSATDTASSSALADGPGHHHDLTIVTSGAFPWFNAAGANFVSALPGVEQDGREIRATGIDGLPGGPVNGYEIDALVAILRNEGYRIKIAQVAWSGAADQNDIKDFLLRDPQALRTFLISKGALGADEPVVVANSMAATAARKQAGWTFTDQPHYLGPERFIAHRALTSSEFQVGLNKNGAPATDDAGAQILVPSSTLSAKLYTAAGNLFSVVLMAYGIDPTTASTTSVTVGNLTLVASNDPKTDFQNDPTSLMLDFYGMTMPTGGVQAGSQFPSKAINLDPGANPAFAVATASSCTAGWTCARDLAAVLDQGIVKRICDGELDRISGRYEPSLKLAPPVSQLAPGFSCATVCGH
jgi:hypothetical protein